MADDQMAIGCDHFVTTICRAPRKFETFLLIFKYFSEKVKDFEKIFKDYKEKNSILK